ncbi:MAG: hypothetical protein KC535_06105, partial [Nanoarchaeota archaeon]|nr:hypothetical protein [Nanoarchaeota archaeon]
IIKEPAQFVDQVHFYLQKEDLRTSKEISSLIIEKFLKKNSEKPEGAWGSFGKMYSFAKDQNLENYLGPLIKLTVESASREKDRNERERKIEATLYQFYRLNDSFSPAQRKEIQETIAQTYLQLIDSTKHSQSANIYTLIQGLHPSKKVLQKADSLVLFK